jgi:hypothetical protein
MLIKSFKKKRISSFKILVSGGSKQYPPSVALSQHRGEAERELSHVEGATF